jgi:HSP20 family protein
MFMRSEPFRELDRLIEQTTAWRPATMPMDAYREGDRYIVHFDLPGVDPDSIELTVERNVLTVAAERHWDSDGSELLADERTHGRVSRQLYLGDALDTDHLEARYERGVLTVTIPVSEHAKARRIPVGAGTTSRKAIEASASVA